MQDRLTGISSIPKPLSNYIKYTENNKSTKKLKSIPEYEIVLLH